VLLTLASNVMGLTINSPTGVAECEPLQFTWTTGTPPYFLSLIPGANQSPIKMFPQTNATSLTWIVDLQAGTTFTAALRDNTGTQVFSAAATIIAGTSTSCVNTAVNDNGSGSGSATGGATSGASGATSAATTAASSVAHSSGAASGAATSSVARSSGTGAATSTSTSSTASKSSGATLGSSVSTFGIAGIFGLVGAALF